MTRSLLALLERAGLPAPTGAQDVWITGITDDSRRVQPGNLFVAYRGVEADGRAFIPQAIARGAAAVVRESDPQEQDDHFAALEARYSIPVSNGRRAFALLCAAWHDFPARRMTVVGVTGTDGKTTTTNLLFSILRAAGHNTGMISTVNAVIGDRALDTGLHTTTPDADEVQALLAQMRDAGVTHCVLEVTSHGLAHHRVDGVDFDVAVITNITHEHLDLHGSREAYRAAKARLFEMAPVHVLNADDDYSFNYLVKLPARQRIFYSREIQPNGDYGGWWLYAPRVDRATGGIAAYAFRRGEQPLALPLRTHLIGDYNISNILAAAGAALALGASPEAIQAGVAALRGIPGRMERIDEGQPYLAVVDFAHTPNALEHALLTLRRVTPGRLIVVFGCAGERDAQKRFLMGKAAAELADVAIFTAEDPRRESLDAIFAEMDRGARAAQPARATIRHEPDRGEAIRQACALAVPGDTVVACGKGHEQSLCFGATEYAWDDREAMRRAIRGERLAPGELASATNEPPRS
ncbi:UDP-N-acetylmuramoyl-L-alanyl-D-glutamate--2,6-diaminopimelate ligase [Azonexus hydrophilus]|uniref:UDP-N-acetylmuramoyl-L-alanyl-D-glutamate--2, 6-diaminopimelate ligase n=1 Tax=Azonexus hydrophilus TaxID=418702 RepID=UPI002492D7CA|nr:UDP-N-acetylmuramoyl-L-alanyl-D-glutamate--2,6-diaminopimelate ligase [Azonexus hydrophilus]